LALAVAKALVTSAFTGLLSWHLTILLIM